MIDINKSEKLETLNTKIYITKGDYVFKTGEFYDVVNGKIIVDSIVPDSHIKDTIPYQTTFRNELELNFYFMEYEKRKRIASILGIDALGWSHEGIEYIDINILLKLLKSYSKTSSKADEILIKSVFNKL